MRKANTGSLEHALPVPDGIGAEIDGGVNALEIRQVLGVGTF